jgi:uncharacterized protein (DUF2141 family)
VTVTGNYVTQYYLTLATSPPGVNTPTGAGWYDAGSSAPISTAQYVDIVAGSSRYRFNGWTTGDMSEITNASSLSTMVLMDKPKTVTANYVLQYYLTITTSPAGVNAPSGQGWYDNGTLASISTAQYVDIVAGSSRYRFNGWTTGDMSEITDPSATSTTVLMDKAKTVTANYVTQYYLTLTTSPLGVNTPTGEGWYDSGTYASISTAQYVNIILGSSRYRFNGWTTTDMSEITNSSAASTTVLIDKAKIVTANYVIQYYLTVEAVPVGLIPAPVGEGWYDGGTKVTLMAPAVSYLSGAEYMFVYWDVDGVETSNNPMSVHMDAPHTATAHYWFPSPIHLDAEPPRLIDLTKPLGTQWDELYPDYGRHFNITSWHDTNGNGLLDPSDYVDLWDTDMQWQVQPYLWHVDDITVTLKVTNVNTGESAYIEFEGGWPGGYKVETGWAGYYKVIVQPTLTQWHEVYPNDSNNYRLDAWFDNNGDGKLDSPDRITLLDKATGKSAVYQVDEVKTDVIVSPRATEIVPYKMKDYLGKRTPMTIFVGINDYYETTTAFTVAAYYNGLNPIGNQTITLNPLQSGMVVIQWWNPAKWPRGTYNFTITIDTYANGTLFYHLVFPITFKISIVGDLNGDGKVDMLDIGIAALAFGTRPGDPRWNPNADVTGKVYLVPDGKVDMLDIAVIAKNFGNKDP